MAIFCNISIMGKWVIFYYFDTIIDYSCLRHTFPNCIYIKLNSAILQFALFVVYITAHPMLNGRIMTLCFACEPTYE